MPPDILTREGRPTGQQDAPSKITDGTSVTHHGTEGVKQRDAAP